MQTIEKLLRQQSALARFGSFAFREINLKKVLTEAARVCAESLDVPYATICRYRAAQDDLVIEAAYGWHADVIGCVVSLADESSTQGRAFFTGKPVILEDVSKSNDCSPPSFYAEHGVVTTADVLIKGKGSEPWGVLEADSATTRAFHQPDIDFLTGFANVVAEAVATAGRAAILHTTIELMESSLVTQDRLVTERDALQHEKEVLSDELKHRLVTERDALQHEKEVLSDELKHRLRNILQIIFGMLNRQIDVSDEAGKDRIRSIARRVMSLSAVYDHLLGNGLSRTIDFDRCLRSLCEHLREFQEPREFAVTLTYGREPEPLMLDLDAVTALSMVVAEIISNSYHHGFPGRAGAIHVTLARGATGAILTIGDDGVGFVEPVSNKRHGLGLVRRLMEQIGGTARVVSHHGTEWTFAVPTEVSRIAA
jgi:two-component sensor histidine kinase/putative methionine-R-sulfoxide reductase with GAF domain